MKRQTKRRVPAERTAAQGLSRRVVVVHPEEEALFEEIIYVLRDDAFAQPGVTAAEVLRQAEDAVSPPPQPAAPPVPRRDPVGAALPWLSALAFALAAALGVLWYFLF